MATTTLVSRVAILAALGAILCFPPGSALAAGEQPDAPDLQSATRAVALPPAFSPPSPAEPITTTASLRSDGAEPVSPASDVASPNIELLMPAPMEPATVALMDALPEVSLPEGPVVDIAELMRGLPDTTVAAAVAARIERYGWPARLPESDRRLIAALYGERQSAPLWISGDKLSADGQRLIDALGRAGDHGLNPRDYAVMSPASASPDVLAEADIALTAAAVLYARDARGARIEPSRLSALLTPKLTIPDARTVMTRITLSADPAAAIEGFNPRHPGYTGLQAHLATLRAGRPAADTQVQIPDGPTLRVGMRDERIQLIRARLQPDASESPVYDRPLANAVAEFQRQAGLPATGTISRATIEAMQAPRDARLEADLIANMERWRWLPEELGETYVFVAVPEFRVQFRRDGELAHDGRVIVGKSETPTPVFSDAIDHLVMNPAWFIPPSIMKNDILPGLARDPDYAAKKGYEVIRRGGNITVRQPPGERNALGNVKIMFPNRHAVYLHDTPGRHLFARDRRALSHGCVRVEQPLKLASAILSEGLGPEWTEQRLRGMVGAGERMIRLGQKIPVHLTYFTHRVDASGELQTFEDLYGFNRLVRQALGYRG